VRDVAPKKIMLCVSFRVPQAVAFAGRQQQQQQQQPEVGQECGVQQPQQEQQAAGAVQEPLLKKPKV
jgi:hypothetical protein